MHEYILQLDRSFLVDSPSKYNKLKVLDMRADKDNIGYLSEGAFGRIGIIRTTTQFNQALSLYFNDIMAGNKKGDNELLLVLYGIKVEDKPNGEEIGTFHFDGDFFSGKNGEYEFIRTLDTLIEVNAGKDVTNKLIEMVQYQIPSILTQNASLAAGINSPIYTETTAIEKRKQDKLKNAIYKTTDFKKGIYYTVDQFLANTPVDSPFIKDVFLLQGGVSNRKVINFYYSNKKGKKGEKLKDEDFFAVYDGKSWYLSDHPNSITMYYKDNDFYAYKSFKGLVGNDGVMVAGMVGAVTGGIILGAAAWGVAGAAAENRSKKTTWAVYYSRFDPVTKKFKPVSRK